MRASACVIRLLETMQTSVVFVIITTVINSDNGVVPNV